MFNAPMIDGGGNSAAVVSEAIGALTPKQRDALAPYVFDLHTQQEIATEQAIPRSTVQKRIRTGCKVLAAHGVKVRLPGKGRRPARVTRCDPQAMERLEAASDAAGYTTGRTEDGYRPSTWSDSRSKAKK